MTNELSKSFDNNKILLEINNILDFSFGDDETIDKNEDVNMIENMPNNMKIEEEKKEIRFTKEKSHLKAIKNLLSPKTYINLKDSTFSKRTPFLICRKRKRKNELFESEKRKDTKNKYGKKSFPYNSFLRNKSENIYSIYEKIMNIKEDSFGNNRNTDENNNDEIKILPNSKGYNLKKDYNLVLHKFKRISLDKNK